MEVHTGFGEEVGRVGKLHRRASDQCGAGGGGGGGTRRGTVTRGTEWTQTWRRTGSSGCGVSIGQCDGGGPLLGDGQQVAVRSIGERRLTVTHSLMLHTV